MSFKSEVRDRGSCRCESKGDDCDEVICAEWGEPGDWKEWGWRN